jgi:hypothetical protein
VRRITHLVLISGHLCFDLHVPEPFRLDLADARRFSLCRGDLLDVAFEPARLRREAGRAGVWQFGLSERSFALEPSERRQRNGCDAQGRGVRCRHPQELFQPKERADRTFLNPDYAEDGNHPAVYVSCVNAKAYVDWLSRTTGKS